MTAETAAKAMASSQPLEPLTNGAKWMYKRRYIDIGVNLTDPIFTGYYHGTQRHPDDLAGVLARAYEAGCEKMIVTGSDLHESRKAVEMAKTHPGHLYATVGVHPCNCYQFTNSDNPSAILTSLRDLALSASASSHAVAFGEIGLDYDRLEHCPKDIQLQYFTAQLEVAVSVQLPLFLHSRAAHSDFFSILSKYADRLPKRGVVHSFTGTREEMWELVGEGWNIGVNGCSMKTVENCEVVREVPLQRLQIETDGPWCDMRPTHASASYLQEMGVGVKASKVVVQGKKKKGGQEENKKPEEGTAPVTSAQFVQEAETNGNSEPKADEDAEEEDGVVPLKDYKSVKKEKWQEGLMVKGRNEPCMIGHVAWAIAGIKGISVKEVADAAWRNSVRMFGVGERAEGES